MTQKGAACAREVLDVVPTVMRFIKAEMRSRRTLDLSVPQFRSLVFIERTPGTSLSSVAEHLGLTPPSACKLIDGLANRGLVKRRESREDRRRVTIEITPPGATAVSSARSAAQESLCRLLGSFDERELSIINRAMYDLRQVFAPSAHAAEGRT
jgi:DNA-binding MarR family transcriptional regulator